MPGVHPVGLRPLLVAAQRAGLGRLGEMHPGAHRPQLLDHEPPPGRRLQRHFELLATKPRQEPTDGLPMRRRDPRPGDLARVGVDPLRGDLRTMLIQSHHDRHHFSSRPTRRAGSVQPDPSHSVSQRSALRVRMTGRAAGTRARLQRMSFDAEGRPPAATTPLLLMPSLLATVSLSSRSSWRQGSHAGSLVMSGSSSLQAGVW